MHIERHLRILGKISRLMVCKMSLQEVLSTIVNLVVEATAADACLIYLADQFNTGDILTLDRHFHTYRWRRTRRFHLLVELQP